LPVSLGSMTALKNLCVSLRCLLFLSCCSSHFSLCARSDLGINQLSGTVPSSLGSITGLDGLCVTRRRQRSIHALTVSFLRNAVS
jgi:hypothetical protein